jgi:hypothetical protein
MENYCKKGRRGGFSHALTVDANVCCGGLGGAVGSYGFDLCQEQFVMVLAME